MTAIVTPLECFVTSRAGLRVRVRLMGQGPALVMCHESPRSGAALLPLAARLADRFTCVMFDTPGFGLSEPLTLTRPEIPQYASVFLDVAAQLGLGKVPYYGTHTGAAIAIEADQQAPDKVSAVFLDGYALFTETERDELLASYLTPMQHSLDGSHVAWLWSRVRDQFTAFPWHRVGDAGRLPFGPPPIETVQAVVDDFLLADDHYRAAYAAAFRYDHLTPVQESSVPVYLTARADDLLLPHLQNATDLPDNVTMEELPADRDAWGQRIGDLLASHVDEQQSTDAQSILARLQRIDNQSIDDQAMDNQGIDDQNHIANTSTAAVVFRFDGLPDAEPLLLLHDSPGDMTTLDSLAEHLANKYRVIRLDLPGLGVSRLHTGIEPSFANLATGINEALSSIGMDKVARVAFGASLPLALNSIGSQPLIVIDPWHELYDCAVEVPELNPRWDGSHLFSAFYWSRDYELYKPWYHRINAEGRKLGGERDTEQIHKRYRAAVLGGSIGSRATQALYQSDCASALGKLSAQTQVLLYRDDPDTDALQGWAANAVAETDIHHVSRDPAQLAHAIKQSIINAQSQLQSA